MKRVSLPRATHVNGPDLRWHGACKQLHDRNQRIIVARFGLQHLSKRHTLKELGYELGVSCERVCKIEACALDKLRLAARKEGIELPN